MTRVLVAPFTARHYRTIWNMFRIGFDPWSSLRRYLFEGGDYPYDCRLRTPVGTVGVTLFGADDVITLFEVFYREDYRVGNDIRTAVDIGANIGISGLYFMTRNGSCRAHLFEPDPHNLELLRGNLADFEGRFRLHEYAVADSDGEFDFGIEGTGRYGGIGVQTGETIHVRGRDLNTVLEEILSEVDEVDILRSTSKGSSRALQARSGQMCSTGSGTIYVEGWRGRACASVRRVRQAAPRAGPPRRAPGS